MFSWTLTRKQLWLRCLEPQIVFGLVNICILVNMLLDYFHTQNWAQNLDMLLEPN